MAKTEILEYEGLVELVNQMKQYVDAQGDLLSFSNRLSFPSVGQPGKIYVDLSTDLIYRWDDKNANYFQIGFNPDEIRFIHGGNSKS